MSSKDSPTAPEAENITSQGENQTKESTEPQSTRSQSSQQKNQRKLTLKHGASMEVLALDLDFFLHNHSSGTGCQYRCKW